MALSLLFLIFRGYSVEYTEVITRADFCEKLAVRGYDLYTILDTTHFRSTEDAIDDFLTTVFDSVYELINEYRGKRWCKAFFEDMSISGMEDVTNEDQIEMNEWLIKALVEQAIFIYDNGNSDASASKEKTNNPYGEIPVRILWNHHIIRE